MKQLVIASVNQQSEYIVNSVMAEVRWPPAGLALPHLPTPTYTTLHSVA